MVSKLPQTPILSLEAAHILVSNPNTEYSRCDPAEHRLFLPHPPLLHVRDLQRVELEQTIPQQKQHDQQQDTAQDMGYNNQ